MIVGFSITNSCYIYESIVVLLHQSCFPFSPDLLRAALNVMMPIATDYPHAFAGHFRVSYTQGCSKRSALSIVSI